MWRTPGRASSRTRTGSRRLRAHLAGGSYPPNGYGLHDMIGNVWEWTGDWYAPQHEVDPAHPCCAAHDPRGGREDGSYDPSQPHIRIARKVLKGGSHLRAPNYCRATVPRRASAAVDTSTGHVGFRCIAPLSREGMFPTRASSGIGSARDPTTPPVRVLRRPRPGGFAASLAGAGAFARRFDHNPSCQSARSTCPVLSLASFKR